jgi:hypothetical protein
MRAKKHHYAFGVSGVCFLLLIGLLTISNNKNEKVTADVQVSPASLITYTNTASKENIVIDLPFPGAVTGKTFSVIGKARGTWFFEASFPVAVLDVNGKEIARGVAVAGSDWMTTEFVPFKADIKIPESYMGKATLVLKNDNPSGLKEKDISASFSFTIEY